MKTVDDDHPLWASEDFVDVTVPETTNVEFLPVGKGGDALIFMEVENVIAVLFCVFVKGSHFVEVALPLATKVTLAEVFVGEPVVTVLSTLAVALNEEMVVLPSGADDVETIGLVKLLGILAVVERVAEGSSDSPEDVDTAVPLSAVFEAPVEPGVVGKGGIVISEPLEAVTGLCVAFAAVDTKGDDTPRLDLSVVVVNFTVLVELPSAGAELVLLGKIGPLVDGRRELALDVINIGVDALDVPLLLAEALVTAPVPFVERDHVVEIDLIEVCVFVTMTIDLLAVPSLEPLCVAVLLLLALVGMLPVGYGAELVVYTNEVVDTVDEMVTTDTNRDDVTVAFPEDLEPLNDVADRVLRSILASLVEFADDLDGEVAAAVPFELGIMVEPSAEVSLPAVEVEEACWVVELTPLV